MDDSSKISLKDGIENRIASDTDFETNIKLKLRNKFAKFPMTDFEGQWQSQSSGGVDQKSTTSFLESASSIVGKPSNKSTQVQTTTSDGLNHSKTSDDQASGNIQVTKKSEQSQTSVIPDLGLTKSSVTSDRKGNINFSSSFSINGGKTVTMSQSSSQNTGSSVQSQGQPSKDSKIIVQNRSKISDALGSDLKQGLGKTQSLVTSDGNAIVQSQSFCMGTKNTVHSQSQSSAITGATSESFIQTGSGQGSVTTGTQKPTTKNTDSIRKIKFNPLEPRGSIVLLNSPKPTSFLALQKTKGNGGDSAVIVQKDTKNISTSKDQANVIQLSNEIQRVRNGGGLRAKRRNLWRELELNTENQGQVGGIRGRIGRGLRARRQRRRGRFDSITDASAAPVVVASDGSTATNIQSESLVGGIRSRIGSDLRARRRRLRGELNLSTDVITGPGKVIIVRPTDSATNIITTDIQSQGQTGIIRGRLGERLRARRRNLKSELTLNTELNADPKKVVIVRPDTKAIDPIAPNIQLEGQADGIGGRFGGDLRWRRRNVNGEVIINDNLNANSGKLGITNPSATNFQVKGQTSGIIDATSNKDPQSSASFLERDEHILTSIDGKPIIKTIQLQRTASDGLNQPQITGKLGAGITQETKTSDQSQSLVNSDLKQTQSSLVLDGKGNLNLNSNLNANLQSTAQIPSKIVLLQPVGSAKISAAAATSSSSLGSGLTTEVGALIDKGLNLKSSLSSTLKSGVLAAGKIVPISVPITVPINLGVVTEVGNGSSASLSAANTIACKATASAASVAVASDALTTGPQIAIASAKTAAAVPVLSTSSEASIAVDDDSDDSNSDGNIGILGL